MNSIETIFVEDNLQQAVKLEPLSDDDNADTAEKIGEIYRLTEDHFLLVCSHCNARFSLYIQFVGHIEQHLQQLQAEQKILIPRDTFSEKLEPSITATVTDDTKAIDNDFNWPDDDCNSVEDDFVSSLDIEIKEEPQPFATPTDPAAGFRCTVCHKIMKSELSLKKHMRLHNANCSGECPVCGRYFVLEYYIKDHMKNTHKADDAYRCDRCEERFKLPHQLRHHQQSHRASSPIIERGYECYQCHETFDMLPACYQHLDDAHWNPNRRNFQCTMCSAWLKSRETLKLHVKLCSIDAKHRYQCQDCLKEFKYKHLLRTHRRTVHPPPKRIYNCRECDVIFENKAEKQSHMKRYHWQLHSKQERGNFECDDCGKKFTYKTQIREHIRCRCMAVKAMFTCDICHKLLRVSYKSKHMQLHRNGRHHQCAQCGAQFTSTNSLRRHRTTHIEERKFQCNLCPKNYKTSRQLTIHTQSHTGKYSYVCPVCSHGFSWKASLKKHMLSIHQQALQTDATVDARHSALKK